MSTHRQRPSTRRCGVNALDDACSSSSRDTPQYKEDLGNAVVNYARVVPDGLLVFFPSYIVLKMCIEYWKNSIANGA